MASAFGGRANAKLVYATDFYGADQEREFRESGVGSREPSTCLKPDSD